MDELMAGLEVSIVSDHHEFRDTPLACPNCRSDLTEAGSVDQFQYVPARRRGRLEVNAKNEASFAEDAPKNRWHQTDDRDFCPVTHYACSQCDWVLSGTDECTC